MLGVDPPRPLPAAAYDLQTALESVQHFATQTLAAVVQSEATRGSDLYDPFSGARSPRHMAGGWKAATAAAKEDREGAAAAAAAGLVEGWEAAWPPRELTAALGLVTARQMAHAMRCDAEPLIQVRQGSGGKTLPQGPSPLLSLGGRVCYVCRRCAWKGLDAVSRGGSRRS